MHQVCYLPSLSAVGPFDMKQFEKERQKKNNHNMSECLSLITMTSL